MNTNQEKTIYPNYDQYDEDEEEKDYNNEDEEEDEYDDDFLTNSNYSATTIQNHIGIKRNISKSMLSSQHNTEYEFEIENSNHKKCVWTPENESILYEWCDNAQCYIWLHNRSCNQCSFYYTIISIPCIILSTITGSAALATNSFPHDTHFYEFIVIGSINIFVGILTMLEHFLKFSERKESHRLSSISWDKFLRNIRVELAKKQNERMEVSQFLKLCNHEYDHLIELSPVISTNIIEKFNKTFSGTPGSPTRKRFDQLKKPDILDSMITTNEGKYKRKKKEKKKEKDEENGKIEIGIGKKDDLESNIKAIHFYIDSFNSMFGRKPLTYEIIDNLKEKVNHEILGHFLENYTIEDAIDNV